MTTDAIQGSTSSKTNNESGPVPASRGRLSGEGLYVAAVVAVGAASWILAALALLSGRLAR